MPRDRRAYLWDVLDAIRLIEEFTRGKSLDQYSSEPMLRSAVERQLEVIGEAVAQGIRHFPELSQHLTDNEQIVAFRNRLIHGYSIVSDAVVWGVIQNDLPVLKRQAEDLALYDTEA
jgi:uncharacterized protein with HEPN domain